MAKPFPKRAERVRQLLRVVVPRPRALPKLVLTTESPTESALRWDGPVPGKRSCPLGLLPGSIEWVPTELAEVDPDGCYNLTDPEVAAFIEWWDEETDSRRAVDTVWGRR